jgi:hypothetical protein
MTTKNHCMIDIETLSTRPNAPILSVGAAFFDPMTGEVGETFYRRVDIASAMKFGAADPETIRWWLKQNDEARLEIAKSGEPLDEMLNDLNTFYNKGYDAKVWGNGSGFDITILEYAYHRCLSQNAPWPFWNVRDVRTVVQLAEGLVKKPAAFTKDKVAHNALDDCIFQIGYVSKMWAALRVKAVMPVDDEPL